MPACTWNPSDKAAGITLSGGNLSAIVSSGGPCFVRATASQSTGKWYWENTLTGVIPHQSSGFANSAATLTSELGTTSISCEAVEQGSTVSTGGGFSTVNAQGGFTTSNVLMFAVDFDAGKMWIGKNGTWSASGNPATGVNPWMTFTANMALFPAFGGNTGANSCTTNFGGSAFSYTIPSGFKAWTVTAYSLTAVVGAFALTGQAAAVTWARTMAAVKGTFVLTGCTMAGRALGLVCSRGQFVVTGTSLIVAHLVAPATKYARRLSAFVLQKRRVSDPTLED